MSVVVRFIISLNLSLKNLIFYIADINGIIQNRIDILKLMINSKKSFQFKKVVFKSQVLSQSSQ
ncbi:hypothetical protein BpHYR1_038420 [Brachionus plicatilis]|uniref:Uncharacterized protein n=1 Tax=Brachionus plicatilis TaxID=10195 RepID=A0A3M7PVP8_BRAPC|nr:hypothetical protein BpHYR1_038420 [Brachionus plicatilis]